MSISSLGAGSYQLVGGLGSSTTNSITSPVAAPDTSSIVGDSASSTATAGLTSTNTSALNSAITQALSQINPNLDLTSLLSTSGQQSSSAFTQSLLNSFLFIYY